RPTCHHFHPIITTDFPYLLLQQNNISEIQGDIFGILDSVCNMWTHCCNSTRDNSVATLPFPPLFLVSQLCISFRTCLEDYINQKKTQLHAVYHGKCDCFCVNHLHQNQYGCWYIVSS
ncbi:unnamed protein product, partial [Heterosigma akashiwo]